MTARNETSQIIVLEGEGGATFAVNVVELFAEVVGKERQNVPTVLALLRVQAEASGINYQPHPADALNILERAGHFYHIEWSRDGGGYDFVKRSSGTPLIFRRGDPFSLVRERVDPADAARFQELNPDWEKVES